LKVKASRNRPGRKSSPGLPSFEEERLFAAQGYRYIAGIDEVGRGALAGPVVAAAVILPLDLQTPWLERVRDSKQLTPAKREGLFDFICNAAVSFGVGAAECEVIDLRGIAGATRLAMRRAVEQLSPAAEALLIDWVRLPEVRLPQKGIPKGDSKCYCIACASIIAKVTRDRLMTEMDGGYPGYGLARHKGYGTREHLDCLSRLGPSPIHRQSFRPVRILTQGLL
jgi:ribonuclease HII